MARLPAAASLFLTISVTAALADGEGTATISPGAHGLAGAGHVGDHLQTWR